MARGNHEGPPTKKRETGEAESEKTCDDAAAIRVVWLGFEDGQGHDQRSGGASGIWERKENRFSPGASRKDYGSAPDFSPVRCLTSRTVGQTTVVLSH